MEEYEAYIDKLPEKIIKTLEEADGHPPSEEELREIYEAHKELKRNVEALKEEMNNKMEKLRTISERLKNETDVDAVDLVTELIQSCGLPCDEVLDETSSNENNESIKSNETNETKEPTESDEVKSYTNWQEDGAYGIDFNQIEAAREYSILPHEGNISNLTKRTYDFEEASTSNTQK